MSWGNLEIPGALRKIIALGKRDDSSAEDLTTDGIDNPSVSETNAETIPTIDHSASAPSSSSLDAPFFASYPSPPPHLRYLELKWKQGAHQHQQQEAATKLKVNQLLAALDDKEEELSHLVVRILLLVSHAKALWEENCRSKRCLVVLRQLSVMCGVLHCSLIHLRRTRTTGTRRRECTSCAWRAWCARSASDSIRSVACSSQRPRGWGSSPSAVTGGTVRLFVRSNQACLRW